jgi:hypothetical protein
VAGGSVDLYGVQVGGNIQLPSAFLARGLSVRFGRIGGYLFAKHASAKGELPMPPLEIGRDDEEKSLDLSGSRLGGVECDGVKMDGTVQATTGEFGRFYLTPLDTSPGSQNMQISPCEAAGFYMRSVAITDENRGSVEILHFWHISRRPPAL